MISQELTDRFDEGFARLRLQLELAEQSRGYNPEQWFLTVETFGLTASDVNEASQMNYYERVKKELNGQQ
jgi:hypothetical protein